MKGSIVLRITVLFTCLLLHIAVYAQHFVPVVKGSKVLFQVNSHKDGGGVVKGTLSNIKGGITFDPKSPGKSSFDVTVNAGSVHTGDQQRDNDLKGTAFFASAVYPEIRIKSTSITADGSSGIIYILHGTLTMKGVTKPVNIQFTATPAGSGYLFRGSFQLNRLLYNVGEKGTIDNAVTVFIEVKAERK